MPKDLAFLEQVQERIRPFNILIKSLVSSTNDIAKQWGQPFGVVVADGQTHGRGRLQRSWYSPRGQNIYMSIILPLPKEFPHTGLLPATIALAIREALRGFIRGYTADLKVKWPNDVFLKMKKLCGILIERLGSKDFIVGIGINVNMKEEDLPSDIKDIACSLYSITGQTFNRGKIIEECLAQILSYRDVLMENPSKVVEQFNSESLTTGRYVRVRTTEKVFQCYAIGMDQDGALMVKNDDGSVQRIISADVEVLSGSE